MIKIFDKNSWKSDLFYLGIQFLVAWELMVALITYNCIPYEPAVIRLTTVFILTAIFFLIYQNIELKPGKPLFITMLFLSLLNIMYFAWMVSNLIVYITQSAYHPAFHTYAKYISIVFFLPAITYLLGFVGKKTFYLWAVIPIGMSVAAFISDILLHSYPHLLSSLIAKFI